MGTVGEVGSTVFQSQNKVKKTLMERGRERRDIQVQSPSKVKKLSAA